NSGNCNTSNSATFTWDGTDGSSAYVKDGTYPLLVTGYQGSACNGNSFDKAGDPITVSNIATLQLSPAPASVSLSANQSVAVIVPALNYNNNAVPSGNNPNSCASPWTTCQIRLSQAGSVTSTPGTFSGGGTTVGMNVGDTATGCPTLTSGQACTIYTLGATKT